MERVDEQEGDEEEIEAEGLAALLDRSMEHGGNNSMCADPYSSSADASDCVRIQRLDALKGRGRLLSASGKALPRAHDCTQCPTGGRIQKEPRPGCTGADPGDALRDSYAPKPSLQRTALSEQPQGGGVNTLLLRHRAQNDSPERNLPNISSAASGWYWGTIWPAPCTVVKVKLPLPGVEYSVA